MGCGASLPARLHPKPTPPAASDPAAAAAAARSPPNIAHVSSSSVSDGADDQADASPTHKLSPAATSPTRPSPAQPSQPSSASPVSGAVTAPLSFNRLDGSARNTPSPGPSGARFSLNHRPRVSPQASHSTANTPPASSTSGSPQQRMSLAAFPMTDEAKAKLERQRNKRHTNTEPNSFSLPPSAIQQPPAAAHSPMRRSLSKGQSGWRGETPLSPSRSQRLAQQRLEFEADMVDGLPPAPVSPKSQREMRLSRHASGVGGENSMTRFASIRSISRRVFDIDGVDGLSVAPVSTTASEADGSDSDREAKDRLERRRTASTKGRFTQTHGIRELMVPQRDRRSHNLSAEIALTSSDDEDGRRRSLSQSSAPNPEEAARRPRLHLRTTSPERRNSQTAAQPISSDSTAVTAVTAVTANVATPAATTAASTDAPDAADNRRGSVLSSQRRMRRFTKTRHSNTFEGTEIPHGMTRCDSRGQPINTSISQDDPGWYAAATAGAEERDNGLQVPEQPAMTSSSSSSDGSISPVRVPRGHVRSVSTSGSVSSQRGRLKQRSVATSGSFNLTVPAVDGERVHRPSHSLAVPQSALLPTSPSLSSSANTSSLTPPTSYPPSAQLSPTSRRHQSRGKHLALLYCTPLSSVLLSVLLHKLGYHVLTADTGVEAVSLALHQKVDVVVAEWMDGEAVQLAASIRAGEVDGERTAVVVLCADGADEEERSRVKRECVSAGCVGVMESGVPLLTALPDLSKKSVGDGCWYVNTQSVITQIVAAT